MALFVDGPGCTIDDLTDQDAGLLDVAVNAGINASTKLRLAVDEIGSDLLLWLKRPRSASGMLWGPVERIGQVVITPALKRWECMHTLALIYRDAYFSQLIDRYQPKWQEYARLARDAREIFIATGVGIVVDPIVQALPPTLSATAGSHTGGTFYAGVSFTNAAGQEGAGSFASSITVADGNVMTVQAVSVPENAVGFNVYAGASPNTMQLQNDLTLPTNATFLYVPGVSSSRRLAGDGQPPDYTRPLARTVLRA